MSKKSLGIAAIIIALLGFFYFNFSNNSPKSKNLDLEFLETLGVHSSEATGKPKITKQEAINIVYNKYHNLHKISQKSKESATVGHYYLKFDFGTRREANCWVITFNNVTYSGHDMIVPNCKVTGIVFSDTGKIKIVFSY